MTGTPPTPTPTKTVTPIPSSCDRAQFISDVTVPDGTAFNPGAPFTKIWRLRNFGACAWNASYALVFVSGDRMQTRNVFPIPQLVRPGELVDLSADFIAPSAPGRYRSNWMLSNTQRLHFWHRAGRQPAVLGRDHGEELPRTIFL